MLLNVLMILLLTASGIPATEAYEVEFSTYIGGTGYEHIRDIYADKQGNVYITGGTTSSEYPTTPGAYQRTHGGMFDIFVTKFDPTGNIIWSTLVGGKDYDRAYAIEVDDQGYVYVGGRGGRNAPITPGVVQEKFKGQWSSLRRELRAAISGNLSLLLPKQIGSAILVKSSSADSVLDANRTGNPDSEADKVLAKLRCDYGRLSFHAEMSWPNSLKSI